MSPFKDIVMVNYAYVTCSLKQKQAFIWLTNMQFGAGSPATAHVSSPQGPLC